MSKDRNATPIRSCFQMLVAASDISTALRCCRWTGPFTIHTVTGMAISSANVRLTVSACEVHWTGVRTAIGRPLAKATTSSVPPEALKFPTPMVLPCEWKP